METFLTSDIKCISCGRGPINFSIICDENDETTTKYGEFCSMGCVINNLKKNADIESKKIEIDLG